MTGAGTRRRVPFALLAATLGAATAASPAKQTGGLPTLTSETQARDNQLLKQHYALGADLHLGHPPLRRPLQRVTDGSQCRSGNPRQPAQRGRFRRLLRRGLRRPRRRQDGHPRRPPGSFPRQQFAGAGQRLDKPALTCFRRVPRLSRLGLCAARRVCVQSRQVPGRHLQRARRAAHQFMGVYGCVLIWPTTTGASYANAAAGCTTLPLSA